MKDPRGALTICPVKFKSIFVVVKYHVPKSSQERRRT
jgi:hypothetical protein